MTENNMLSLSVYDRGLHYGDGLFETYAVQHKQLLCWTWHGERLIEGCQRLGFPPPDLPKLYQQAHQSLPDTPRSILKLLITRGVGGRGYRPPQPATPHCLFLSYPYPAYPPHYTERGVKVRVCTTRLACQPLLAGLKHLNRLEQVLARQEWDNTDIAEGLMLDTADNIIEGTMTNLFIVKGKNIYTPDVTQAGIAGVMRRAILTLAPQLGFTVTIGHYNLQDCLTADELLLTNSVIGLWTVQQLNNQRYSVGTVSQTIRHHLRQQQWIVNDAEFFPT
ncbi:aminodeoxychorismate lyase [Beggiatoa leptomitoformis]|uniref:Aminodeoxychorismate lyase n=1 Tax=Beggiatoa leptomitoformis TaxID=288004 RepID=A0A2N9YEH5_9GAMM|nr:aminodeoxychorismate lyase [Beggiatoa leptomitoformis]ALG68775.1 aminodeoxychorismate lyase [Beggiatoa leptomitoformis]AUI68864.1 aminodeoxychorismate lyase [Beggiatoa leptomitoformis]